MALNKRKWIVYNKNCDRYAIGVQQTQLECEVAMNTLLGQRIREQRKEKGWTIEQFAERVDLSANYVGDLERGVKIPKLETFIRIVEVLDVSADVLIRDSVPSASHVADDELSRKLSQLTPGQKKAAIDILNAYTDNIPYITK
jgi:transcriptional regulator with XRE-family HTH domain